jgi:Amt family ammonium transporter
MSGTLLTVNVSEIASSVNGIWVLTVSFLIFFMQPGFVLLEAGQVRAKNVANVAMKNLFDWSTGVLAFFLIGLGVAKAVGALTSSSPFSLAESFGYINDPGQWIGWFFGAVFAMTAATIVSGAVAERIKFKAYVVFSIILTMIIYPVVVGITWQGGLLAADGYLGQFIGAGYLDFAGATVVHMVGGTAGLVAAAIVGPRIDRYNETGESTPIPGHSALFAVVGTLFLAFGWFGFNVGTQATVLTDTGTFLGEALGRVVLVTTLGMAAGAAAASIVTTYYQGKPDPLFTANGLLAGLVAITGAAPHVTWWGGLLLGGIGGAIVYPTYLWTVDSLKVDDVCGVFAVHGAAGAVGTALIPFFAIGSSGGWTFLGVPQVIMQVVGVAVIGLWTVTMTIAVFTVIRSVTDIRVNSEVEEAGLDQTEHNILAYPQFATDGGIQTGTSSGSSTSSTASSQGTQEADEATMWRGQEVETQASVLQGAGIDSLPDPAFVIDADHDITSLNSHAIRFFQTTEQIVGDPPDELVDESANIIAAIGEVIETGQTIREQRGSVTIHDETIPIVFSISPLYEGDEVVGAMTTLRNSAEEVATEEYRNAAITNQQEKLEGLADGDLDIEAGVPDPSVETAEAKQLQAAFEAMDEHIVQTIENIGAIVEKLPGQSEELAQLSTELSDSSTGVQASMEEVIELANDIDTRVNKLETEAADASHNVSDLSASIEEITSSTTEIADQSAQATEITNEAVDEMVETVEYIREAAAKTTEASEAIDELESDMQSVSEITTIIQDIAQQTNLLALNASIEAENANESGDGFAVVAEEVKTLAEETKSSADDIDQIITTAQDQTETVAETISETTEEITTGADAVESAVSDLETVKSRIEETNDGINEISDAVDNQAENTQEVSTAVQRVEDQTNTIDSLSTEISEQVAAESTEIGTEMEGIAELADTLNRIATEVHANIDRFDLGQEFDRTTPTSVD